MREETDLDWGRLTTYLAGEGTPAERAEAERWIQADPARRALAAELNLALQAVPQVSVRPLDNDVLAQQVKARLQVGSSSHAVPHRTISSSRRSARWWMMAGATACVLVAAGVAVVVPGVSGSDKVIATREYASGRSERILANLPDGSRVTLAPQTRLQYRKHASGTRVVELNGQASFTVTHDPANTFTVRTGSVTTRVLGTQFDVRSYATESMVQVAVLSGKVVSAGKHGEPVILTPGMMGVMTDSTSTVTDNQPVADATSWVDGKLVFVKTQVPAALQTLSRWYDYEFKLADSSLARARITTVLHVDNQSESLRALQEVLDVTMTFDGKIVTLHPRRGVRRTVVPVRRSVDSQVALRSEKGK